MAPSSISGASRRWIWYWSFASQPPQDTTRVAHSSRLFRAALLRPGYHLVRPQENLKATAWESLPASLPACCSSGCTLQVRGEWSWKNIMALDQWYGIWSFIHTLLQQENSSWWGRGIHCAKKASNLES